MVQVSTWASARESFQQHRHKLESRQDTHGFTCGCTNSVEIRIFLGVSGWQPKHMGKYISTIGPSDPNYLYSSRPWFICQFQHPGFISRFVPSPHSVIAKVIAKGIHAGHSPISREGFRPVLVQHGLLPPSVLSFRFHLGRGLRSLTIMRCMQDQLSGFSTLSSRRSASFSASFRRYSILVCSICFRPRQGTKTRSDYRFNASPQIRW